MEFAVSSVVCAFFFLLLPHGVRSDVGELCSGDADCRALDVICVLPLGCSRGFCACRPGMGYDPDLKRCRTAEQIQLGQNCSMGSEYQKHVENANCFDPFNLPPPRLGERRFGLSKCLDGYSQSGTSCTYNLAKPCTADIDCKISPLTCRFSMCRCKDNYKASSAGICIEKNVGDLCTSDADCSHLDPYNGSCPKKVCGYGCTSSRCACMPGFQQVQFNNIKWIHPDTLTIDTVLKSYCVPIDNITNARSEMWQACNSSYVPLSSRKASFCDPSLTCVQCLGETQNNYLMCRPLTVRSSFNNNNYSSNFEVSTHRAGTTSALEQDWWYIIARTTAAMLSSLLIITGHNAIN